MTKCSVIGQKEVSKEKKSVEFCKYIPKGVPKLKFEVGCVHPNTWDNIMLLYSDDDFDYMYGWCDGFEQDGYIYQGHWNDGVVE